MLALPRGGVSTVHCPAAEQFRPTRGGNGTRGTLTQCPPGLLHQLGHGPRGERYGPPGASRRAGRGATSTRLVGKHPGRLDAGHIDARLVAGIQSRPGAGPRRRASWCWGLALLPKAQHEGCGVC
jgi:hypothetical protein